MKTNTQFWLYLAQFFLEWEMFQTSLSPIFPAEKKFSDIIVVITTTTIIAFVCF
jgi:hypothetical protein